MKLAAFPGNAAFLPALAAAWLAQAGDPSRGLIILPNRRAARALAAAFLPANGGKALLLPRIIAPGAIDEAGLTLTDALELPPAVPVLTRQAMLAKLILAMNELTGGPTKLHAAWRLAADLAALLDEADEAEISLATRLPDVVGAELASHWQKTLQFLEIVTHQWPAILADMGMVNPAARQAALIDAQAAAWRDRPPGDKIWLVTRDAGPALSRLARVVAGLPNGAVILPGYDWAMDNAAWDALEDGHAAGGIARLLGAIGARREEICAWAAAATKVPQGRAGLLSEALLPAASLQNWQQEKTFDLTDIYRLEARDEEEEAAAIAMALRDALQVPGTTTALVTPDRGLAIRVAASLKRFGVVADDSAGEALADTPPAIFLRLLARAAEHKFAPLPLLALLKHPLAAVGEPPEICRGHARALDILLRGPRPSPGFAGIKYQLQKDGNQASRDFLDRLELRLVPIAGLPEFVNPVDALRTVLAAGEALAATPEEPGAGRLWGGQAGAALANVLAEALAVMEDLPLIAGAELADLLEALLACHVIRRPRTKDGHSRIAIWGVQEASLQTVDVVILGGLVEGVWPAPAEPGPWLSRPMRKAAGLASPEQKIGQAAHDFFSLASACPNVILSSPIRRERAPAVPARWVTRLDALLTATGQKLALHDAASWARQLDNPAERSLRPKPEPKPPAALRPTRLSISDIATLMADPYAIYAKHVLKITRIDDLDEESDPSLFGNIVHDGLKKFFDVGRNFEAPDAAAELTLVLQIAMRRHRPRAALEHWWAARLERIAGWIVAAERDRRRQFGAPVKMGLEIKGELNFPGGFSLYGRADRIEQRADGIFIMDYKTGSPPTDKQIEYGSAPQLPLEAFMVQAGAFGEALQGLVTGLGFWKLSGRGNNGEDKPIFPKDPAKLQAIIEEAGAKTPALFRKFGQATTPYLAAPHPERTTYDDPYNGISRRGEWGGEGGGAE